MLIAHVGPRVQVFAPAKVNLFLEIVNKRDDGFHNLISLMTQVTLWDILEFEMAPAGTLTLEVDNQGLPTGDSNLIIRAAKLLCKDLGQSPGARIRLTKRIPMEAGLGGGSSNAAAALVGLSALWGHSRSSSQLQNLAAQLGSDVSFFLAGPAALCTGRGEICEPRPTGKPLWLVMVQPDFGLSTKTIYESLDLAQSPHSPAEFLNAWDSGDFPMLCSALFNRLEEPALCLRPEIGLWKERLLGLGAGAALMTGSGSVVLGLFPDGKMAYKAAGRLETGDPSGMVENPGRVRSVRVVQTLS